MRKRDGLGMQGHDVDDRPVYRPTDRPTAVTESDELMEVRRGFGALVDSENDNENN